MIGHKSVCLAVVLVAAAAGAAMARPVAVSATAHRALLAWPLKVPDPFTSPADVTASALAAVKAGQVDAYAAKLCKAIGDPANQGTRQFYDMQGVKLWPMFTSLSRAASLDAQVASVIGDVLVKCTQQSPGAGEAAGYGVAWSYSEGLNSIGMTKALEAAFTKGGGCKAVGQLLDVAVAVTASRMSVEKDALSSNMPTYSKLLGPCTPKDAAAKFKPTSMPVMPLKYTPGAPLARGGASDAVKVEAAVPSGGK